MNKVVALKNAVERKLSHMFPQFFALSTKHDHFKDFGWPDTLDFSHFHRMYTRNSLAAAGVDKTIAKTWQEMPAIWETEKPKESKLESKIRQRFEDMRLWQMAAETDRRSMVGRYAGLIIRYRDSKTFDQPVGSVPGGINGIAGVIPAWESQLTVSQWDDNPESEGYGTPTMYQFNETALDGASNGYVRQFKVHPDRVLLWSDDGTVNCRSALEPGYNDLIDAEKIKGAGGEGFWKSSRGAPIIEAGEGMTPQSVAEGMGVTQEDLHEAINQQIDAFQTGFDKGLMLGGMTAKPLQITLPIPEHFFAIVVNSFAASMQMPVKILLGSQTGERASTEDAREWSQTCNSRRLNRCVPMIREMIRRFEAAGILPKRDWHIGWGDLTEATAGEKLQTAKDMSEINAKAVAGDYPPFTPDEIREAAGFDPMVITDYDDPLPGTDTDPAPEPDDEDDDDE